MSFFGNLTRTFAVVLFIGLSILLEGCNKPPEKTLRLGGNIWVGYETLHLAQKLGYYDDLALKLVEMPSATDVMHAFRHHMLELAALTLDEALSLKQTDDDIQITLVFDFSQGADILLGQPEIKSLAQLKNKKVGVENTAVGAILLDSALTEAQLTPADIKIIPLTANEHQQAFNTHQIDAVVTFEPIKSKLLAQGANNLFDSRHIPNRIVDVLVVRKDIANQHPEVIRKLLSGYFKALDYLHAHPTQAIEKIAPRMQLSSDRVAKQYDGIKIPSRIENIALLRHDQALLSPTVQKLLDFMLKKKLLYRDVSLQNFLNGQFLSKDAEP